MITNEELETINLDEVAAAANSAAVDTTDETLSILAGAGIGLATGVGLTIAAYFLVKKYRAYKAKKAAEKTTEVKAD